MEYENYVYKQEIGWSVLHNGFGIKQEAQVYFGQMYGTHISEAHHIEYFIKSMNNDASNQMIVCPNHHRIIHSEDPVFNRKNLMFVYPNGYSEGLKLNLHL